jgi:hypothetical protein
VQSRLKVDERAWTYLNTGTWADLVRVPKRLRDALASGDDAAIRGELESFLAKMKSTDFAANILRRATFGRIVLDDSDLVVDASVRIYQGGDPEQSPELSKESADVERAE